MQGRLGDAKKILDKTSESKEEAETRLADIKLAAAILKNCTDEVIPVPKRSHGEGVWKEFFLHPTPSVCHVFIASVFLYFYQEASGIDAVILHSPRIFKKAGITSSDRKLLCMIAVGLTKTAFIFVATFLLVRNRRRPLLLISVGGMIFSQVILGISLTIIDQTDHKVMWAVALSIAMVLAFVAFFSIGMGPVTWVYTSEIFPLKLRAQGVSIGVGVQRVTSGVISMTFISLYKAVTIGGAFSFFSLGLPRRHLCSFTFYYRKHKVEPLRIWKGCSVISSGTLLVTRRT